MDKLDNHLEELVVDNPEAEEVGRKEQLEEGVDKLVLRVVGVVVDRDNLVVAVVVVAGIVIMLQQMHLLISPPSSVFGKRNKGRTLI